MQLETDSPATSWRRKIIDKYTGEGAIKMGKFQKFKDPMYNRYRSFPIF